MGFDNDKIKQLEQNSFVGYYIDAIKNHYFDFNGRARRKAFWFFVLINFIVNIILSAIDSIIFVNIIGFALLSLVYTLAILLPSIGLAVRRLHDIGKSGWWYLINLIPIIGFIWFIILAATDSQPGSNQYGENPKGE
ncbi:MAG: DUF805 domain-containing protein [Campylobacteraceae bacterium]|jgi:uncharacterized membrane protein YhaH (DUF805 family)|nr:DUF805 domain-containing protein [Campylobacteraceae bacterium]